jgi:pyruvate/2-oxoglutarate dehydrogenase complex dihydrolipoamide acyltransferase (E2) component
MLFFSDLRGFGAGLPVQNVQVSPGTTATSKSDRVKQLQCLLNIVMTLPEVRAAIQKSSVAAAWRLAAWTPLKVDGTARKADADTITTLSMGGIRQFWSEVAIIEQTVAAYADNYVAGALQLIEGRGNTAGCDFPAQTAAAQAAAAAAAQAAVKAAAEAQARAQAEAVAIAAAQAAAAAAASADAAAAQRAAIDAQVAANAAATQTAQAAADAAAASAAQAATNQQQATPSSSSTPPGMEPEARPLAPTQQQQQSFRTYGPLLQFLDTNKVAVGVGLLLAAAATGAIVFSRRR